MLARIDKHVDHETIRQAFENAKRVGIETIGLFIIGPPGDSRSPCSDDRLRHRGRSHDFQLQHDDALSGTRVYEEVKRHGRLFMKDWEDYVFFDTRACDELGDLTAELVDEMYNRPPPVRLAATVRLRTAVRREFRADLPAAPAWPGVPIIPCKEKKELRPAV